MTRVPHIVFGSVDECVEALRAGGLAAFPSETLWALGCRADVPAAVAKVFAAKGRPEGVPLAVGFATFEEARPFVEATPTAERLARRYLPGPLSLVVRRSDAGQRFAHVAPGRATLSIRVPDHAVARVVLEAVGPVVMTSANWHGARDALTREDLVRALQPPGGQETAALLQVSEAGPIVVAPGGPVPGTGSTVVDCTGPRPVVLREGIIPTHEVEAACA